MYATSELIYLYFKETDPFLNSTLAKYMFQLQTKQVTNWISILL